MCRRDAALAARAGWLSIRVVKVRTMAGIRGGRSLRMPDANDLYSKIFFTR